MVNKWNKFAVLSCFAPIILFWIIFYYRFVKLVFVDVFSDEFTISTMLIIGLLGIALGGVSVKQINHSKEMGMWLAVLGLILNCSILVIAIAMFYISVNGLGSM